ncbi:hypothetical protein [Streptomyces sp. NRRL S-813]|nr:hypothetical protein [Streptomyces sp. NRRL S-813]
MQFGRSPATPLRVTEVKIKDVHSVGTEPDRTNNHAGPAHPRRTP